VTISRYAEKTSVSAHRSIEEIDHILKRYGATQFATGRDDDGRRAIISFRISKISYKLEIPIPDKSEFAFSGAGYRKRKRTPLQIDQAYEQAYRQRWRAMALVIKAKLEATAAGISSIEKEFMPDIMLPGGITVKDYLIPQLADAMQSGKMPLALPFFEGKK
jgi:hypothetical protein